MKRLLAFPLIIAAFHAIPHARAQGEAEQIANTIAPVAGSVENNVKLAQALHKGKVVALRGTDANGNPSLVAFGVPAEGMSWTEVQQTMQKAQATLQRNGVREASVHDVQAALLGGEVKREDGSNVAVEGVLASQAAQAFVSSAGAKPATDGSPIYGNRPALPNVSASTWGSYRPAARKSAQIEHRAGIINAGYLR